MDIEQEIAKINEKIALLVDVVFELKDANIELEGSLSLDWDTKQKMNKLKFGDTKHTPIGER